MPLTKDPDAVSWDTGETQAERYDLSKQVDKVYYSDENQEADDIGQQKMVVKL